MKRRMNDEIIWDIEENRKKLVSQSIEKKEKWGRLDSQKCKISKNRFCDAYTDNQRKQIF